MDVVDVPSNPIPKGLRIGWLESSNGLKIRIGIVSATAKSARGTVVICPGRTEFIEKYFEVARDLQGRGFACLIIDWPGQGLSDRLTDNRLAGHINKFSRFTDALGQINSQLCSDLPRPHLALAHSMGSAILLKSMSLGIFNPKVAAFSAPMFGISLPNPTLKFVIAMMCLVGRSSKIARESDEPEVFETNPVTNCKPRWEIYRDLVEAEPRLRLGSPTWGWINQSIKTCKEFAKPKALQKIDAEILIATAGQELLVDNRSHDDIAQKLKNCTHITVSDAKHEILMEVDGCRNQFWKAFDETLERAGV